MNELEIVENKGYCITQLIFQTAITECNTVMFYELPRDVEHCIRMLMVEISESD